MKTIKLDITDQYYNPGSSLEIKEDELPLPVEEIQAIAVNNTHLELDYVEHVRRFERVRTKPGGYVRIMFKDEPVKDVIEVMDLSKKLRGDIYHDAPIAEKIAELNMKIKKEHWNRDNSQDIGPDNDSCDIDECDSCGS